MGERERVKEKDCEYITQLYKEPVPCYLKSVWHGVHAKEWQSRETENRKKESGRKREKSGRERL